MYTLHINTYTQCISLQDNNNNYFDIFRFYYRPNTLPLGGDAITNITSIVNFITWSNI